MKFVAIAVGVALLFAPAAYAGGSKAVEILDDGTKIPSVASDHRPTAADLNGEASNRPMMHGRTLAASGCKTVDVYRYAKSSLFFTTVYRFHHVVRWCWNNYNKVTSVNRSVYVSHMDSSWYYRGLVSSTGNFYQYFPGTPV